MHFSAVTADWAAAKPLGLPRGGDENTTLILAALPLVPLMSWVGDRSRAWCHGVRLQPPGGLGIWQGQPPTPPPMEMGGGGWGCQGNRRLGCFSYPVVKVTLTCISDWVWTEERVYISEEQRCSTESIYWSIDWKLICSCFCESVGYLEYESVGQIWPIVKIIGR